MALDIDRGAAPPLLRVTGPADLARAIPYLLGFHPVRSFVVVGMRAKRVAVTARMDLDDLLDTPVLDDTLASFVLSGVQKVVGVVFDDSVPPWHDGSLPWSELADDLHSAAGRRGIDVDEVALVACGRLWSYDCDNPVCCPPEGRLLASESSPIAATAAYAGLVALPGREDLAAQLARRIDPAELHGLLGALRDRADRIPDAETDHARDARDLVDAREVIATARAFDAPGHDGVLTDAQRLDFAVALRRIPVRDAAWLALDTGEIDGRALWQRLATSLPAPYDAAPLFLFGWASYRDGNGALARIAAERAVESDPYYSAADLILAALSQGLDPRRLPRFTRDDFTEVLRAERPAGEDRKRP